MTAGNILQLLLRAKDEASAVLDKAGGNVSKFGAAIKKAAAVGGVAIIGMGAAMTTMAAGFESSMAEVRTLIPQLSEEGFGQLQQDVLAFSREMGLATSDVVPALYQAISAGVPPDNVLDFMKTAAAASIGGVTELETAVDGITSVVNSYGSEVLNAQQASDLMFTGVRLGKTTFDELSQSLFQVVPTASSMGIGFEQITAAMAAMTSQGVPTSVATTQLRQALVEASQGGTELDKAIREMAGKGFTELIGEGRTAFDVLQQLRERTEAQGGSFNDLFGSVEAMNAALALTGGNFDTVQRALDEMTASTGATNAAFETVADTASFKFKSAMNNMKSRMTEIGLLILPHVTEALGGVQNLLADLGAWIDANRDEIKQFFEDAGEAVTLMWGHFRSGVEVVWPVVRDFFNFLMDNKPLLIAAIAAIGIAIVTALGPISGTVLAITGLITLIGFLRDNWDEIWQAIKDIAEQVWGIVKGLYESNWGWLLPGGPLIKAVLFIGSTWRDVWDAIRNFASDAWSTIKGLYESNWGWLLPGGPLIKAVLFVKDKWDEIWGGIETAWDSTSGFITDTGDGIISFLAGLPGRIASAFSTVARVVTTPWRLAMDGVRQLLNAAIDGINSFPTFSIPDWVPGIGGNSFSLPNIPSIPPLPEFAEGGVVPGPIGAPVLAKVHGGETIIPPGRMGGTVLQFMPGAFSFPNFVGSKEDLRRLLVSALSDLERTGRIRGVMP